jgi:anti-sigma factor RsiW
MTPLLDHDEVQELLGAYALDAVDDDERRDIEGHLESCPRCRGELDAYREVAAAIGNCAPRTGDPPGHLWDRVASNLRASRHGREEGTPDAELLRELRGKLARPERSTPPASVTPIHAERNAQRRRRQLGALAAAALVIIAGLGIELARLQNQVNQAQSALAGRGIQGAVVATLDNPLHRGATLRTGDGRDVAQVVALDGHGYLLASDLVTLPGDRTYQLWGLISGQPVSLGLLGGRPGTVAFSFGSAHPSKIMITVEPSGGVTTPTQAPLAQGVLTS